MISIGRVPLIVIIAGEARLALVALALKLRPMTDAEVRPGHVASAIESEEADRSAEEMTRSNHNV